MIETVIQALTKEDVHATLVEAVVSRVVSKVSETPPLPGGRHCLRISALPRAVMGALCKHFADPNSPIEAVLVLGPRESARHPWEITSTRLIELRNALETSARPLLAFVPPALKAAAEDSFDVSTFREFPLARLPREIAESLAAALPVPLREVVERAVAYAREQRGVDDDDAMRYLLTVRKNGYTREAAGASIYQLGLIPDFDLFVHDDWRSWLDRNFDALKTLDETSQPLLGRLHNLGLKANTLQVDLFHYLRTQTVDAVREWGEHIAADPALRRLAFDRWQFEGDDVSSDELRVYLDDLALPTRDPSLPLGEDNPLYFDINRQKTLSVNWTTTPKPSIAGGLAYFRVEIVSSDNAVVWEGKNIKRGAGTRASRRTSLKADDFRERVEDGLYFIRVDAYSDGGDRITSDVPRDPDRPDGKRINESGDVWFWNDKEPPPADPQRNISVNSFLDAQLQVRLSAIDDQRDPFDAALVPRPDRTNWTSDKSAKRLEATYNIVYDAQARFTLAVSHLLRRVEGEILSQPQTLGRYRLNFTGSQAAHLVTPDRRAGHVPAPHEFIQARTALFQALVASRSDGQVLTATVDLTEFADAILGYAIAYAAWLESDDPAALDVDRVDVEAPSDWETSGVFPLIAPTHPVRLLWHLQRARLAEHWLRRAGELGVTLKKDGSLVTYLRQKLASINLPPILPMNGRVYVEQEPISLFWGIYLPPDLEDGRLVRARLMRALGLGRGTATDNPASGFNRKLLADKLQAYVEQYPFVKTLKLNCFNPGDAAFIVDSLLELERRRSELRRADLSRAGNDLRYELRLFTRDARIDDMGEAIDDLLNPQRQVSAEADAFSVRSKNPLFPKLRYSRNRLDDFLNNPDDFEAHLSILHDFFRVSVDYIGPLAGRSSFVHGLVQEQVVDFETDGADLKTYAWRRQLQPVACVELPPEIVAASELIARLLRGIDGSHAAAVAQAGRTPTLCLVLSLGDRRLLHQVHTVSNWVLTIDRHLGLEYFDSADDLERPIYLLDFVPDFAAIDNYRLMLTTRSADEASQRLHQALESYGLEYAPDETAPRLLLALRSLSGRLAFRLLAARNRGPELLGLAMARLYLEATGDLRDLVVVPLDAHVELLRSSGSGSRADLLLVSCDHVARRVTFTVVEVKWRQSIGDGADYDRLTLEVETQLRASEVALRELFEDRIDEVDRAIRAKRLISLLAFYSARSVRYGLVSEGAADNLTTFVATLDQGYTLDLRSVGLLFDLSATETTVDRVHDLLTFVRVGRGDIERLIGSGAPGVAGEWVSEEVWPALEGAAVSPGTGTANPAEARFVPETRATELDGSRLAPPEPLPPPSTEAARADVLLGDSDPSPQYGVLGQAANGKFVALDLNGTNTISLFGVQGGGKSYTLGVIAEMATKAFPHANVLPAPLATVIFHYHESQDYPPEFISMIEPNTRDAEVRLLAERYGVQPGTLDDVVILASQGKIADRRREFPSVRIEPILFASNELAIKDWRFLMGVGGNQMYMKQINLIMRQLRQQMTLETLRHEVDASGLSDTQKSIARSRLTFAEQFIDDDRHLAGVLQAGRLIIVDLRDEFIDKDEALGLFVVLLNIFANTPGGFNKLIVFDEAHKYMSNEELTGYIVDTIRQMRHQGVSVLIASQDPLSLPDMIIELSSILVMHRFNSPKWLRHVQRSINALGDLTPDKMAALRAGEAYVWASKATDRLFTQKAMKIEIRPRITRHGGGTRTAG